MSADRNDAIRRPDLAARVWSAVRHRQPEHVPWQVGFTSPVRRRLEDHFGTADLDSAIGNHMAKYKARLPDELGWLPERPGFWRDEFGVVWNRTIDRDIGVAEAYPLAQRSLAGFRFPDPLDPRRYAGLEAFFAAHAGRFRYLSFGFSLFERAWSLRGMEALLVDMVEAPSWVDELLDAITAFDLAVLAEMLKFDFDAVLFGDDWGQQRGLIFGPRLWRRFVKPRIALLYATVKAAGKAVMIHSCGKVQELFPELIELGLDVFNPFQPDVMDPVEMKRLYGDRLAFFGGVSVQSLLPRGTPAEVRAEVRRLKQEIGCGGGFILGPSHDLTADIPLENVLALIEAAQE